MLRRPAAALALLATLSPGPLFAAGPPTPSRAYPLDLVRVPVADRARLQDALDQNGAIRLDAGDYRSGGPAEIVLRSGQQIHGLPGTGLPRVVVAPGTRGAVLSNLVPVSVELGPGDDPISENLFRRLHYTEVVIRNAKVERNLFLDLDFAKLTADTSTGGWLLDNRFIRLRHQAPDPALSVTGDRGRTSTRNVLLWSNVLTVPDDAFAVDGHADFTFVGFDIEVYSDTAQRPLVHTGPMGSLRMLGTSGAQAGRSPSGLFDVAADELVLVHNGLAGGHDPQLRLRPSNARSVILRDYGLTRADEASSPLRFDAFERDVPAARVNGAPVSGALDPAAADAIVSAIAGEGRQGAPWERPSRREPPDPAGPGWAADLASKPDSADSIQAQLDAGGVVILPPGLFYISRPLRLGAGVTLLGSGADRTAIIAKDPSIDIIVADGAGLERVGLNLADITLQGGRNGIHHEPNTAGYSAQFFKIFLSHVTFRSMSEAGIFVERIYAWDNAFLDRLDFVDCAVGFKQYADPAEFNGMDGPRIAYVDKVVFYECQFIGCGTGVELSAERPDNLNAWIGCRFEGNTRAAARLRHNNYALFANTDFIDNAGDPVVEGASELVSCRFSAGARGTSMIGGRTVVEGSTFERGGSSSATILSAAFDPGYPPMHSFLNTRSSDLPLGSLRHGLLINSELATEPALSGRVVLVDDGRISVLAAGASAPSPGFLVGASFAPDIVLPDGGAADASNGSDASNAPDASAAGADRAALDGGALADAADGGGGAPDGGASGADRVVAEDSGPTGAPAGSGCGCSAARVGCAGQRPFAAALFVALLGPWLAGRRRSRTT